MKITKIAPTVKMLLINNIECRDNDNLLILKVWAEQEPKLRHGNHLFRDFAIKFIASKFASTESIRRSRQKLQEEFPSLRGANYIDRKNRQNTTKKDLRSLELLAGGTP